MRRQYEAGSTTRFRFIGPQDSLHAGQDLRCKPFLREQGGGLEVGETPSAAVIREVNEETGQQMRIGRLIDVQSDHWIGRAPSPWWP